MSRGARADDGFQDLLKELCAPLGDVVFRRMFGGVGVFRDGLMFALLSSQGVFHFKVDAETEPAFEAEGCGPFTVEMRGRTTSMGYRRAPERLFDDPEEFLAWARDAFAVAVRADRAKGGRKKRAGKTA